MKKIYKNLKKYMKTTSIEIIKPNNENKTASQICCGCNKKIGGPIISTLT